MKTWEGDFLEHEGVRELVPRADVVVRLDFPLCLLFGPGELGTAERSLFSHIRLAFRRSPTTTPSPPSSTRNSPSSSSTSKKAPRSSPSGPLSLPTSGSANEQFVHLSCPSLFLSSHPSSVAFVLTILSDTRLPCFPIRSFVRAASSALPLKPSFPVKNTASNPKPSPGRTKAGSSTSTRSIENLSRSISLSRLEEAAAGLRAAGDLPRGVDIPPNS
jgi:hypothetical protein